MFCPGCGAEDRQHAQFCRGCGLNLGTVRVGLERPDAITASAVSARDEIGRAIASRIQQLKTAKDLSKVAEEVLPEVEKFLESPEERRLRRIRAGVITSAIGLGILGLFLTIILTSNDNDTFPMMGAGLLVFFIGLGIVLNGLFFTVPEKETPNYFAPESRQRLMDQPLNIPPDWTELSSAPGAQPPSVVEHTTQQLPQAAGPRAKSSQSPE